MSGAADGAERCSSGGAHGGPNSHGFVTCIGISKARNLIVTRAMASTRRSKWPARFSDMSPEKAMSAA